MTPKPTKNSHCGYCGAAFPRRSSLAAHLPRLRRNQLPEPAPGRGRSAARGRRFAADPAHRRPSDRQTRAAGRLHQRRRVLAGGGARELWEETGIRIRPTASASVRRPSARTAPSSSSAWRRQCGKPTCRPSSQRTRHPRQSSRAVLPNWRSHARASRGPVLGRDKPVRLELERDGRRIVASRSSRRYAQDVPGHKRQVRQQENVSSETTGAVGRSAANANTAARGAAGQAGRLRSRNSAGISRTA